MVECKTMGKLNHPNINKYKNHFVVDGKLLCILFEFCDRGDLDGYMQNLKMKIAEVRIKRFIVEILLALEYLHK